MAMKHAWILVFWGLQVSAHLCLKFGSTTDTRWWPFFVIGNAFGIAAALTMMKVYTAMNPNVALGLCVGGGFLLAQTVIFLAFRSNLSWPRVLGILAITVGMVLLVTRPNRGGSCTGRDAHRHAGHAPLQADQSHTDRR